MPSAFLYPSDRSCAAVWTHRRPEATTGGCWPTSLDSTGETHMCTQTHTDTHTGCLIWVNLLMNPNVPWVLGVSITLQTCCFLTPALIILNKIQCCLQQHLHSQEAIFYLHPIGSILSITLCRRVCVDESERSFVYLQLPEQRQTWRG